MPKLDQPAPGSLDRGLHVLKSKAIAAAHQARTPAALYRVQQDIVTGAERLVGYLSDQPPSVERNTALAAAHEYLVAARQALARLDRQRAVAPGRRPFGLPARR